MKDQQLLVSVLMTSYNRERYIAEAIESILASTFSNFELIIVDDRSSDDTVAIAKQYKGSDSRIRIEVNDRNLTQFPNRNKAASLAIGKYIKYVDSDDAIFPWTLEYCADMMERYPDAGMGILYLKDKIQAEYLSPAEAIENHFFNSNILHIGPAGTILNRQLFKEAGCFETSYGVPSDMYTNLKMAARFPTVLLKKNFFFYRVHDEQELNNRYSYLCHNYRYISDAMKLQGFPLEEKQKKFLLRKAEVYYTKDVLQYVWKTKKIRQVIRAFSISGMNIYKLVRGLVWLAFTKVGLQKFKPVERTT